MPLEAERVGRLGLVGGDDRLGTKNGSVDEITLPSNFDGRPRSGQLGHAE
jgi:hypothetical protein